MIEISIVIPVYNSSDCIKELYTQIAKGVSVSHEVILVNDQSRDNSWAVISELGREYQNIIGINLRKNSGQDNAIMAGLSKARGRYTVIMDDDLQHSPNDIMALYHKCQEGYDACYARFSVKKQKIWKNFGSSLNGKIAECMLEKPKNLYLSPFKIVSQKIVHEISDYSGPYPYIDGLILSVTDHVTQIDAVHHKRYAGKSNYSLMKSIAVSMRHITGFSVVPLRAATFVGLITACAGFGLSIYYIIEHFATDHVVEGWTTLVVLNLFLGGIALIALGTIGEYVGRSYLSLNRKAPYHIKEIIGQS